MKSTITVVAVMLVLAAAILTIVFNFKEDYHLHCECGIAQCPNEDPKIPVNAESAEMGYLPYEAEDRKLEITNASLPGAQVGVAYSVQLNASGGRPPYTWSIVQGALPPGLTLSSAGLISGTPTAQGSFKFTVQVVDSTGQSARADVKI